MPDLEQLWRWTVDLGPAMLVAAGAVLALLLDLIAKRSPGVQQVAAFGVVAGALVLAIRQLNMGNAVEGPVFAGAAAVDGLGLYLAMVVLFSAALAVLMAPQYLERRGVAHGEYYALLLLATTGAVVLCQATDWITVFLAVEIMSVSAYALCGITREDGRALESAMKYFIAGAFASAFLLYGMALMYGATGSTALEAPVAPEWEGLARAGLVMLLIGMLFKVGAVPFHLWVPDAYEGAPVPVTAFMSVGVKAAGFALLARVAVASGGMLAEGPWVDLVWVVCAATVLLGNVMAAAQTSVKRMLAYSSVAHTGYALLAVAALMKGAGVSQDALTGAIYYMLAYSFMTLGAFAFLAYAPKDGRDREAYEDFDGLAATRPWGALAMSVFMLSLAGIPPTAGFLGKFLLLRAAVGEGLVALAVVAVLATLVSFYYYLRVVVHMYMKPKAEDKAAPADAYVGFAVALCAAVTVLLGTVLIKYVTIAGAAARSFLD